MSADDSTERLRRMKMEALQSGGPERVAARRKRGTGTARERVLRLVDEGTFVELDVFVDGAVTGHGKVDGRDVYIFSQDGEVPQDSLDEAFAHKMVKVMELAMKNGAPLVGLYDCGRAHGAVGHSAASLGGYAELFFRNVMASGLVPQIAAIMGPCAGAAAYSPALMDFTIMVKGASHLHLGGAGASGSGEEAEMAFEELGGARTHGERSGVAQLVADDEAECLGMIRTLLSYLPQNNLEETPRAGRSDPPGGSEEQLESLVTFDSNEPYDMREVVSRVLDGGEFFELTAQWAPNLVIGFGRLGGRAVGVVGNQPAHLDGRLDIDASAKGARFVRFCDAFNLPLVTLVDTPGFVAGRAQEHGGALRAAAQLMYAFCEATVPKVTVITHRAYGEGFEVMCSKHIRADFNFAWPTGEIKAAAPAGALDRQDDASPYDAALRGHLDDVIEPAETRARLIAALEACASKREGRPPKKHGNIPL
jgi:acetyl-CoA carboxylase carboxyltransferase component